MDITKQLEYAMRTLECSPDGVFWSDLNGDIVYVNKAACIELGYTKEELINMNVIDFDINFSSGEHIDQEELIRAVRSGETFRIQTKHKHRNGSIIPVEITMGTLVGGDSELGFSFVRDITKQLEEQEKINKAYCELEKKNSELRILNNKLAQREKELEFQAYHDMLTGLPNRTQLMRDLDIQINTLKKNGKLAVLFIDLDNFKYVNDSFGHSKGDMVLKEVRKRIQALLKQPDQLYRIGGDEFILLLINIECIDEVDTMVEKVNEYLSNPFIIDSFQVHLSCSIGISICPDHSTSAEELLRYSDAAMYKAKVAGKNTFYFFDEEIKESIDNLTNRV